MDILLFFLCVLPLFLSYTTIWKYINYEFSYALKYIKLLVLLTYSLAMLVEFPYNFVSLLSLYFSIKRKYLYAGILLSLLPVVERSFLILATVISINALNGILWRQQEYLI